MKKLTILSLTALTALCVGGQAITTHAAGNRIQSFSDGNRTVITYQLGCNAQDLADVLQNCLQNIIIPDCDNSGNNTPEIIFPENNTPDFNWPETEAPEINLPDSNAPETNLPGTNNPGNNNGSTEENVPGDNITGEHAFIQEVVDLVNIERAKEGLAPLTIDTKVQAAAMVRAKECEVSFSHTRPNGSSFATALKEQNVSYRSAGENIAYGQRSPEEVMNAWMNSSGHRANIMNANYTTIGVGYYENANGTDYWCQLFTR